LPLTSRFDQSLVARRWPSPHFEASVLLSFDPANEVQRAGLVAYYDRKDFIWLHRTHDPEAGHCLQIWRRRTDGETVDRFSDPFALESVDGVVLRLVVAEDALRFLWRPAGESNWRQIGESYRTDHLSDEGADGKKNGFTGAFVALAVQDGEREVLWAEFRDFWLKVNSR
jgi:xylan 1,4-beta-xylosidase